MPFCLQTTHCFSPPDNLQSPSGLSLHVNGRPAWQSASLAVGAATTPVHSSNELAVYAYIVNRFNYPYQRAVKQRAVKRWLASSSGNSSIQTPQALSSFDGLPMQFSALTSSPPILQPLQGPGKGRHAAT